MQNAPLRFDSDYLEGCLPEILDALQYTNLMQTPGYGEDEICAEARSLIREACAAPEAEVHFLVGGTQTNVTVISAMLQPWQGVLCAESGHINVHETGAIEHGGHKVLALPSSDGKISAAQVKDALAGHSADPVREHMVQPGMVYISFPTEKGTLYSKQELTALSQVCRSFGVPLFLDGARLGYGLAAPDCDLTLPDIASLTDVFYIGGTKQGALFGEAVVFTRKDLCPNFRYAIKQNGGMLAKGRLLGLQFRELFRGGLYLRAAGGAIQKALRIREALERSGYDFLVRSGTNQQFPVMNSAQIEFLRRRFSFEDWEPLADGRTAVRFCTSWATTDSAVDELIASLGQAAGL